MADDQQNPFTMAGMMQMMQPNKYINPAYKDKPLPLPGFYGTPTDAQGKPIQSFLDAQSQHDAWNAANPAPAAPAPGTTLNSTPQQAPFRTAIPVMSPTGAGHGGMAPNWMPDNYVASGDTYMAMPRQPVDSQAAPAAAQQNPVDMRQAYLDALSNPGKVTTPGANVPQASPLGSPSVMNSFLAANPSGGGAGAGGYNNSGFFNTLNKLRSA